MDLMIRIFLFCVAGYAFISADAVAEPVFRGTPSMRVDFGPDGVSQRQLKGKEGTEATVVIDRVDGKFIWTSRQELEMVRRMSGIYAIFVAQSGAGYVEVERPLDGQSFRFIEHVHVGLGTITYYGETLEYYE
jgi:hypothetical protein